MHSFRHTPTAPTTTLPPLPRLSSTSTQQIRSALQNLRNLYFSPLSSSMLPAKLSVSPKAIRKPLYDTTLIDSGYASAEDDDDFQDVEDDIPNEYRRNSSRSDNEEDELELLRADTFERAFALKWVTGFVARADVWTSLPLVHEAEMDLRNDLLEEASSILSAFAGCDDEAKVALTRSFSFSTRAPDGVEQKILVELNDAPINSEDHTSVGLQSWGSSILFAERMCMSPSTFLLDPSKGRTKPLRILELGAGTGMLSIIAAKLLSAMDPPAEIVATDFHLDVLSNLSCNVATNFPSKFYTSSSSSPVAVHTLDWEAPQYEAPFHQPFDIILAADVIYHPEHAKWIKTCVESLLTRPRGRQSGGVFWLFIPVRTIGRHEGMDGTVDALFSCVAPSQKSATGLRLEILDREDIRRQGGVGRADEGAYKLSKIGWV